MSDDSEDEKKLPESGKVAISRGALQAVCGAVPFAGGVFSGIAGLV